MNSTMRFLLWRLGIHIFQVDHWTLRKTRQKAETQAVICLSHEEPRATATCIVQEHRNGGGSGTLLACFVGGRSTAVFSTLWHLAGKYDTASTRARSYSIVGPSPGCQMQRRPEEGCMYATSLPHRIFMQIWAAFLSSTTCARVKKNIRSRLAVLKHSIARNIHSTFTNARRTATCDRTAASGWTCC